MGTGKIFGIGLSKTGTSSLARALELLGYRTKDYPGIDRYIRGDLSSVDLFVIESNDAITDTPVPSFYRELDAKYPGSKFILTVREKEGWLTSCKKQFTTKLAGKQNEAHRNLFVDLYDTDVFDEQKFGLGYDRFVAGVLKYFANRPQDLLIIDVTAGEGWEKLCPFLGKAVPAIPFPKANVTSIRWIDIAEVVDLAKRAGRELGIAAAVPRSANATGSNHVASLSIAKGGGSKPSDSILKRALHKLRGGDAGLLQRSVAAADAVIVKGLSRLTPSIPILLRNERVSDHSERAQLNHLWLVDVSTGARQDAVMPAASVVSIALIEDGRPIYGVVCALGPDVLYFGKLGQGAYRADSGHPPERLDPAANRLRAEVVPHEGQTDAVPATKSRSAGKKLASADALSLCEVLARGETGVVCDTPSTEWDTAAAHAIARVLGRRFVDRESSEELGYNTPEMINHGFRVD
jgi:3'-phosphoadenosine 5'-phosphosulfate (PAPS) 3'-phosphatase